MVCVSVSGPVAAGAAPVEPGLEVSCARSRELANTVSIKANITAGVFMCNVFMCGLWNNNGVPRFEQDVACTVFPFDQFFVVHWIFLLRSVLVSEDVNSLGVSK